MRTRPKLLVYFVTAPKRARYVPMGRMGIELAGD